MVRSAVFVSLLAAASSVIAATARVPGAYLIEFEDNHDPAEALKLVQDEGKTRLRLNYKLFNGVSIEFHDVKTAHEKAAKLASLPAIKSVWPLDLVEIPNSRIESIASPSNSSGDLEARADQSEDTFSPHVMTQVDKLRAKGITGKGVKIAIIDTGLDYTHPALGNGCFGKGCLVSFGTDLVGDDYTGYNTPIPDQDVMDCNGHGTHVAGIIAAQPNRFGFTGAAPGVTLGSYRVFGCVGLASIDILIAAFNKAYEDGADIITASIVGARGWTEEPWAVAVSRIVEQGVPCTVSAGNDGDHGLFYISTAANGKKVTAVASYDNTLTPTILYPSDYTVDGGAKKPFGYVPGVPDNWDILLPLYATSLDTTNLNDGCDPLPDTTPDLSDKIVLIRRGTCTYVQKYQNAVAKGAKYIIVYNHTPGTAYSIDASTVNGVSGAAMVTSDVGESWVRLLKAGKKITLDMVSPSKSKSYATTSKNTVTGGGLSLFTSWGPTWEMDFKPQIGAPGGNILSTYPVAKGGYAILSGTSMSCPITAAIIALISEVRGTLDPELMTTLLSANANPRLFNDGSKFYDTLAPAAQQGGGLVQAYDAAFATTLLQPSSLSFNDTAHFVKVLNFTLQNTGDKQVTHEISHVPALIMYTLGQGSIYPAVFPNQAVDTHASLELSEKKIVVGAGHSATIEIVPTPPEGLDAKRLGLWTGYVSINGSDGTSLSLPYQGLAGSLRDSTVLASDQTWITTSTDTTFTPVADNTTFALPAPGNTTPDDVLPALAVNLALGSARIRADIVPMTTCPPKNMTTEYMGIKTIGQPFGFPSVWNSQGINAFYWDGRLDSGNYAPPGKYKFVVRALRIFGDAAKKHDWDVSSSPSLRIKYL